MGHMNVTPKFRANFAAQNPGASFPKQIGKGPGQASLASILHLAHTTPVAPTSMLQQVNQPTTSLNANMYGVHGLNTQIGQQAYAGLSGQNSALVNPNQGNG